MALRKKKRGWPIAIQSSAARDMGGEFVERAAVTSGERPPATKTDIPSLKQTAFQQVAEERFNLTGSQWQLRCVRWFCRRESRVEPGRRAEFGVRGAYLSELLGEYE